MAANIELQAQLNELLEEGSKVLDKQTRQYQDQATILAQMVRAKQVMNATDSSSFEEIAKNLEAAAEAAGKYAGKEKDIEAMGEALEKNSKSAEFFKSKWQGVLDQINKTSVAEQSLKGMSQGFSLLGQTFSMVTGLAGDIFGVIGKLAGAVISFPMQVLEGLYGAAQQGGSNELATAIESVREQFGYLNKTAGGETMTVLKSMRGELANTGLSVQRVFGNMAERLKWFTEYMKTLGPIVDATNLKIGQGGVEALGAFNKALGFSAEAQKAIAARATASGKTVNEVNLEIANYSMQLSTQFGVTMKEVSRSVGEMMKDFENFGHMAPRELAQVAVYARKLGIEVKVLAGVMQKSFNFEDAATQAAQLSQSFGMNIDAMKQLQEQDPGKKLENIRRAFFAAGNSVENMNAQQRRLLATQTGVDEASLGLTFSLKNQSLSYDQIQKKGGAAAKSQLTQAEALKQLAGAIQRLTPSGSTNFKGFFDAFFKGVNTGIQRTREWRSLMRSLSKALSSTYRAGIQVGRSLVQTFPGIKAVFGSIKAMFEPRRFRSMLGGVVSAFKDFFADVAGNKATSLPNLLQRLKTTFFSFFSGNSGNGRALLAGVQSFFKAFALIAGQLLVKALDTIKSGLTFIFNLLTGEASISDLVSGAAGSAGGAVGAWLAPIVESFNPSAVKSALGEVWDVLSKGISTLWETKAKPWLEEKLSENWPIILAVVFGPSFVLAFTRGLLTGIGQGLAAGFTGTAFKALAARAIPPGTGGAVGSSAAEAAKAANGTKNVKPDPSVAAKLAFIAGVIAIGMIAVAIAIIAIRRYAVSRDEIINAAILMTGMAPLLLAAGAVVAGIGAVSSRPINVGAMTIMLIAVAGLVFAMVHQAVSIINTVKSSGIAAGDIPLTALTMAMITGVYLAASAIVGIATLIGVILTKAGPTADVAMVTGLAAIAVMVGIMAGSAILIVKLIKGFGITAADSAITGTVLDMIFEVYLAASAIVGIATLIGAVIVATGGSAALAMLAGLAAIIAMVAIMALHAVDVVKTIKSSGITAADSAITGTVLAMISRVYLAASAITGIATVIGTLMVVTVGIAAAGVVLGLAAISSTVFVLAKSAVSIVNIIKSSGIKPGDVTLTQNTLAMITGVYREASAISDIAGRDGVISRLADRLGGVVAGTGLDKITQTVSIMTEKSKDIVKKISELPNDAGLETKMRVFLAVMGGISSFSGNLSSLMTASRGNLSEFDETASTTMATNLKSMNDLITSLGSKVTDIVTSIGRILADASPEAIAKGQAISGILGSISNLITALKPSPQFITAVSDMDTEESEALILRVREYISVMAAQVQPIITLVGDMIRNTLNTDASPEKMKAAGELFATVFNGVGTLMGKIFEPRMMNILTSQAANSDAIVRIVRSVSEMFAPGENSLATGIKTMMENMMLIIANVPETDIRKVQALGPLMTKVFELIGSMITLISGMTSSQATNPTTIVNVGTNIMILGRVFGEMMQGVSGAVRDIITILLQVVRTVPSSQVKSLTGVANAIGSIFTTVGAIATSIKSILGIGADEKAVTATVGQAVWFMQIIGRKLGSGEFREVMDSLSNARVPTGIVAKTTAYGNIFQGFIGLKDKLTTLRAGTSGTSGTAGADMVNQAVWFMQVIGRKLTSGEFREVITSLAAEVPTGIVAKTTAYGNIFQGFTGLKEKLIAMSAGPSMDNTAIIQTVTDFSGLFSDQRLGDALAILSGEGTGTVRTQINSHTSRAIRAMVNDVNAVSTELARMTPININPQLQTLANNIGLGQSQQFRIQRDSVNITINADIKIVATDLQTVLLAIPQGRIAAHTHQ